MSNTGINADFINNLVAFMVERNLGVPNVSLYIGMLPTDASNAMFVVAGPSGAPNKYVDTLYYGVDVWARYNNYDDARNALQQVVNCFHRRANYDITDFHIYFSHMVSNIEDMDRDPEAGKLLKVGLNFIYRNTNVVS